MSTYDEKLAVARRYVALSNERHLEEVCSLFESDAQYESQTLATGESKTYHGLEEIKEMMLDFYNETVPDVQWMVEKDFAIDSTFEKDPSAVVFDYRPYSKTHEEMNDKRGREWICINEQGKIYYIKSIVL